MIFIKEFKAILHYIVLIFCFVATFGFSSKAQSFTVSGKVVSAIENVQIEFATVKLLNVEDSSL